MTMWIRPRRTTAPLAFAAALAVQGVSAAACTCVTPPAPNDAAQRSDSVFLGFAQASVEEDPDGAHAGNAAVTFNIVRSWKGIEEPYVTVYTPLDASACGYPFEVGRRYLVYAAQSAPGVLATNLCTRTVGEDAAQYDLAELGQGRPSLGGH